MQNNVETYIEAERHPYQFQEAAEYYYPEDIQIEAWNLIQQRASRPEVFVQQQERQDNARTALMEALTASGHLSRVEISGDLEEINTQILTRLLNGWDDTLPSHEKNRRFIELCNELIIQNVHRDIARGVLPADTGVVEISDYPEALAGSRLGYRHKNKKGFVRTTQLAINFDGSFTRTIETVSRSNGTWSSTFGFLSACNVNIKHESADLAALDAPLLFTAQDYPGGVADVMRLLDQFSGRGVLYGDSGPAAQKHVPYDQLRKESSWREQEIENFTARLARLEYQLEQRWAAGTISFEDRTNIFQEEIDRILSAICTVNPEYAEATYGTRAAGYIYEAARLECQGKNQEAQDLLSKAQFFKENITFCGMTISVEKAKEMGLEVNSYSDSVSEAKKGYKFDKYMHCVVCQAPPKKGDTKKMCGPCGICKPCDTKFKKTNVA